MTDAKTIAEAYGLSLAQAKKVVEVSDRLGIPDPAHLANLIWFESDFELDKTNAITGAYGLIQFTGPALTDLKVTKAQLAKMTFNEQMELVFQHINRWKSRIKEYPTDLYMTVFYPKAVGKPDYSFPLSVVVANFGISTPREYAAKADAKARIIPYVWQGPLQPPPEKDPNAPVFSPRNPNFALNMAALVFFSGTLVYSVYALSKMKRESTAFYRGLARANPPL
jgi:hypothetical protein